VRRHRLHFLHDGPEVHLPENIALEVDAAGQLDQFYAGFRSLKDGPLSHIEHVLTSLTSAQGVEAKLLDLANELSRLAFTDNCQAALLDGDF
jgi:hypothetical protein